MRSAVTVGQLQRTFELLGVRPGGVLVAHVSLARLGFVLHGIEGLRLALERTLGHTGTLVVPTFTGDRSDPACWVDPALPCSMWNELRDGMPAFHKHKSLPRQMGRLALSILMDRDALRSDHPLCSFAAAGPRAAELTQGHDLRDPFGPASPIGRARAMGGQVLLLGVDQRRNSAIAHAQCCADVPQVHRRRGAFLSEVDGERRWITPTRMAECGEGFPKIEDHFVVRGLVRVERVGDGTARLMELEPFCNAVEYHLRLYPEAVACGREACRQCA